MSVPYTVTHSWMAEGPPHVCTIYCDTFMDGRGSSSCLYHILWHIHWWQRVLLMSVPYTVTHSWIAEGPPHVCTIYCDTFIDGRGSTSCLYHILWHIHGWQRVHLMSVPYTVTHSWMAEGPPHVCTIYCDTFMDGRASTSCLYHILWHIHGWQSVHLMCVPYTVTHSWMAERPPHVCTIYCDTFMDGRGSTSCLYHILWHIHGWQSVHLVSVPYTVTHSWMAERPPHVCTIYCDTFMDGRASSSCLYHILWHIHGWQSVHLMSVPYTVTHSWMAEGLPHVCTIYCDTFIDGRGSTSCLYHILWHIHWWQRVHLMSVPYTVTHSLMAEGLPHVCTIYCDTFIDGRGSTSCLYHILWHIHGWQRVHLMSVPYTVTHSLMADGPPHVCTIYCDTFMDGRASSSCLYHILWHIHWWQSAHLMSVPYTVTHSWMAEGLPHVCTIYCDTFIDGRGSTSCLYHILWHIHGWQRVHLMSVPYTVTHSWMAEGPPHVCTIYCDTFIDGRGFTSCLYHILWHIHGWQRVHLMSVPYTVTHSRMADGPPHVCTIYCDTFIDGRGSTSCLYHILWYIHWWQRDHLMSVPYTVTHSLMAEGSPRVCTIYCDTFIDGRGFTSCLYHILWHIHGWQRVHLMSVPYTVTHSWMAEGPPHVCTIYCDTFMDGRGSTSCLYHILWHIHGWQRVHLMSVPYTVTHSWMAEGPPHVCTIYCDTFIDGRGFTSCLYHILWHIHWWQRVHLMSVPYTVTHSLMAEGSPRVCTIYCDTFMDGRGSTSCLYHILWHIHGWQRVLLMSVPYTVTHSWMAEGPPHVCTIYCDTFMDGRGFTSCLYHILWHIHGWQRVHLMSVPYTVTHSWMAEGPPHVCTIYCDTFMDGRGSTSCLYHILWHIHGWQRVLMSVPYTVTHSWMAEGPPHVCTIYCDTFMDGRGSSCLYHILWHIHGWQSVHLMSVPYTVTHSWMAEGPPHVCTIYCDTFMDGRGSTSCLYHILWHIHGWQRVHLMSVPYTVTHSWMAEGPPHVCTIYCDTFMDGRGTTSCLYHILWHIHGWQRVLMSVPYTVTHSWMAERPPHVCTIYCDTFMDGRGTTSFLYHILWHIHGWQMVHLMSVPYTVTHSWMAERPPHVCTIYCDTFMDGRGTTSCLYHILWYIHGWQRDHLMSVPYTVTHSWMAERPPHVCTIYCDTFMDGRGSTSCLYHILWYIHWWQRDHLMSVPYSVTHSWMAQGPPHVCTIYCDTFMDGRASTSCLYHILWHIHGWQRVHLMSVPYTVTHSLMAEGPPHVCTIYCDTFMDGRGSTSCLYHILWHIHGWQRDHLMSVPYTVTHSWMAEGPPHVCTIYCDTFMDGRASTSCLYHILWHIHGWQMVHLMSVPYTVTHSWMAEGPPHVCTIYCDTFMDGRGSSSCLYHILWHIHWWQRVHLMSVPYTVTHSWMAEGPPHVCTIYCDTFMMAEGPPHVCTIYCDTFIGGRRSTSCLYHILWHINDGRGTTSCLYHILWHINDGRGSTSCLYHILWHIHGWQRDHLMSVPYTVTH